MNGQDFLIFPKSGIQFLKQLKRHNDRDWFRNHREEYELSVRGPMERIVEAMAEAFSRFAPEIQAAPRLSLYRIYRDTRFSRDKSPYKTHVAAVFPHRNLGKHEGAGFYFHISPSELLVGGGLYLPLPEDLRAVRMSIAQDYNRFLNIIRGRKFRRVFQDLSGEQLTRVPREFPRDHPAGDYLRYKQFLAASNCDPVVATRPTFGRLLVDHFETLHPLVQFLNEPILENRRSRHRQESLLS
jgi:uncharacterized protein (TIGR02453 family)